MTTPPPPGSGSPQVPPPADAFPAPPAPKKKGKLKKVLSVLVAIVVAVGLKLAFSAIFDDTVRAKAGDCVQVTGSENNPEVSTKECGDKDANYKVIKVIDGTFDTNACTETDAALAQQYDEDKFVLCLNDN